MLRRIANPYPVTAKRIILEQLEERIVLDAAVDPAGQDNADENQEASEQNAEAPQGAAEGEAQPSGVADSSDPLNDIFNQDLSVVLISNAIDEVETLSDAVVDGAIVFVYEDATDGLNSLCSQLSDLVSSSNAEISHLAIVSHGDSGVLSLGGGELWTSASVHENAALWTTLGELLAHDARIDLYGCSIGEGEQGQLLVESIASVTEAIVWASDDTSGSTDGSDWDLEIQSASSTMDSLLDSDKLQASSIELFNSAPVLKTAGDIYDIYEDDTDNDGTSVLHLIGQTVTDSDGDDLGIAVTGVDDTHGTWEYSMDGGLTWTAFGSVSNSSATLLSADTDNLIRFAPDAEWSGTAEVTYRAWDQSSGDDGDTHVNTGSGGGMSPFSSDTASSIITVNKINDLPEIVISEFPSVTVDEDNTSGEFTITAMDLDNPDLDSVHFVVDGEIIDYDTSPTVTVSHGTLTIQGSVTTDGNGKYSQSFTFTPDADYSGDLSLAVEFVTLGPGDFVSGYSLGWYQTEDVELADVDGDGDLDVIEANNGGPGSPDPNRVYINYINEDAGFQKSGGLGSGNSRCVATGDIDGDGDIDFVVVNDGKFASEDQPNVIWLNDGAGEFTASTNSLSSSCFYVSLGDLDCDGDLDVVLSGETGEDTEVWFNNGLGVFSLSPQSLSYSCRSALGDVDDDGDLDIVLSMDGGCRLYLNNGTGSFTDSGQVIDTMKAEAVQLADVNGDQSLDLIMSHNGNPIKIWLNEGSGTFSDSGESLGNQATWYLAVADLDGDGDLDIYASNSWNASDRIYLNDGTGHFTVSSQTFGDSNTAGVAVGDVNGDGWIDVVVGKNNTKVYLNGAKEYSSDSVSLQITVNPVNDQPTTNGEEDQTQGYTEGVLAVELNNIVVDDVDTNEQITATLTLADTTTGYLSTDSSNGETYDTGTGVWTITGSVGQVNAALADVAFIPESDNDLDTTVAVEIKDGLEDGSVPVTGTITLDVTPVNDQPTTNGEEDQTQAYTEGASSVELDNIVVDDVDTHEQITATLTLADTITGHLSTDSSNGETYDTGTGVWTITGSVGQVNAALADVAFIPESDNDLDTTVAVEIKDGLEDGSVPVTGTITLDVTPVNDQPTTNGEEDQTQAYTEGVSAVALDDIVVDDVDTHEQITATLTLADITTGYLSTDSSNGETYDIGTGVWTITGSVSEVNAALADVAFIPEADNDLDTTVAVEIKDGLEDGSVPVTGTITLDVTPVNDQPTTNGEEDQTQAYTEGASSVELDNIVVDDVDTHEQITATLTLADTTTGHLSTDSSNGETYDPGTGVWTITGSVSEVNAALASVAFIPEADNDLDTTVAVEIKDGLEDGSVPVTGTITLDVTPVNDAPTTNGNENQTQVYTEDMGPVQLADIVVDDPDTHEQITATLTLADTTTGSLSAGSGNGETYDSGTGVWTIMGSVSHVNAALADVAFIPWADNDLDTTVAVEIKDGLEDGSTPVTGTITLDVTPVNDAPTTNGNEGQTQVYTEDTGPVQLADIVVDDVDTHEQITATLTLADTTTGSLSAGSGNGETYDTGTGVWTITGSVGQVNAALADVAFIPEADNDLDTTVAVEIKDGLEDGSTPVTGTITLDVIPVNDAPTATGALYQTIVYHSQDEYVPLDDIVVADVDTGEMITVKLLLDNPGAGTLTVESGNGETYDSATGVWSVTGLASEVNEALADVALLPSEGNGSDSSIRVEIGDGAEDGVSYPAEEGEIVLSLISDSSVSGNPAREIAEDGFRLRSHSHTWSGGPMGPLFTTGEAVTIDPGEFGDRLPEFGAAGGAADASNHHSHPAGTELTGSHPSLLDLPAAGPDNAGPAGETAVQGVGNPPELTDLYDFARQVALGKILVFDLGEINCLKLFCGPQALNGQQAGVDSTGDAGNALLSGQAQIFALDELSCLDLWA
jgi:hypothetical protein